MWTITRAVAESMGAPASQARSCIRPHSWNHQFPRRSRRLPAELNGSCAAPEGGNKLREETSTKVCQLRSDSREIGRHVFRFFKISDPFRGSCSAVPKPIFASKTPRRYFSVFFELYIFSFAPFQNFVTNSEISFCKPPHHFFPFFFCSQICTI